LKVMNERQSSLLTVDCFQSLPTSGFPDSPPVHFIFTDSPTVHFSIHRHPACPLYIHWQHTCPLQYSPTPGLSTSYSLTAHLSTSYSLTAHLSTSVFTDNPPVHFSIDCLPTCPLHIHWQPTFRNFGAWGSQIVVKQTMTT
jgi:hypothetical protein